jgi:MFS family permease
VRHPLLDLRVFRDMRFTIASITVTMLSFGLAGVMYLAAQYLQNVLGYDPMNAGLAVMPVALMALVASPISARLALRLGSKIVIIAGLFMLAVGFGLASLWSPESNYWLVGTSFVLMGAGVGPDMTPSTNAIMSSLPEEKAGVGSAMNDVTRDFGTAVGIALFGSIVAVTYSKFIHDVYASLPKDQREHVSEDLLRTASDSLSGALQIAERYPGANADALLSLTRTAFLDRQAAAMSIGAGVCIATALLVALLFPSRTSKE